MIDEHAATELKLYIDNDSALYRGQTTSILKSLATKKARGEYKRDLAAKAFGYLVEAGAKKYVKEFGGTWHQMFNVSTRAQVARELVDDFEAEWSAGQYRSLLPKKYQEAKSSHARVKKTLEDYADEGYKAHTWRLTDCPYTQPKIRGAWQRGAWKWQQEQRGSRHAKPGHSARKKTPSQLDREIAQVVPHYRGGR